MSTTIPEFMQKVPLIPQKKTKQEGVYTYRQAEQQEEEQVRKPERRKRKKQEQA